MGELVRWILVGFAVVGIIYNTIVTHVVLKNDLKHLQNNFTSFHEWVKQELRDLRNYLMENK